MIYLGELVRVTLEKWKAILTKGPHLGSLCVKSKVTTTVGSEENVLR